MEKIQAANQANIDRRLQEHMEAMEKRSRSWFTGTSTKKNREMEQALEQLKQERAAQNAIRMGLSTALTSGMGAQATEVRRLM